MPQYKLAPMVYGCDAATAKRLNDGLPMETPGSKARAYYKQRARAKVRGIGWEISFPDWVALWDDSGKWSMRGKLIGQYVMARHGDVGPYRVGNVSIQPNAVNNRDALKKARSAITRALTGSGRGWTYIATNRNRPYQVMFRARFVGSFATQVEAEAAYRRVAADRLAQSI